MAYSPTVWKDGDIVTSAKLNKLEQGVAAGGGVLVVGASFDPQTESLVLDKTAGEIFAAKFAVMQADLSDLGGSGTLIGVMSLAMQTAGGYYTFSFKIGPDDESYFAAATADDYPVAT